MSTTEELIERSQNGDKEAGELLIMENTGLIWSVAKRFLGRGTDADDLYQLGCLGFLKAVDGFDPNFGTKFSTYAVPKISGEIRRFLRDDGAIKVSRSLKEHAITINLARNRLTLQLGREPLISELMEETGFGAEDIALAESATAATESINKESGEDGFTLQHILSDSDSEEAMVERISLKQAVQQLPERERMVIKLRYFHGLTQQKVSALLGVSQVQVSRIEKKTLSILRSLME